MKRWLLCLIAVLGVVDVSADRYAYNEVREVTAANGSNSVYHFHDWRAPWAKRWEKLGNEKMTSPDAIFSSSNDFSFVELRDSSGSVVFRKPSPALTRLWIAADSRFIVGLSEIRSDNPYQLVVWRRDGSMVHRESVAPSVAKMNEEQRREFSRRFPKADKLFDGRWFTNRTAVYLNYRLPMEPEGIEDGALEFLSKADVPHPYSDDISGTVSNWVFWLNRENPEPEVSVRDDGLFLSLRSPTGKRFSIPLGNVDGVKPAIGH